jgi:hypothetical protein
MRDWKVSRKGWAKKRRGWTVSRRGWTEAEEAAQNALTARSPWKYLQYVSPCIFITVR